MVLENTPEIEINEYFGLNTKQSRAKLALGFSSELHDIDLSDPGVAQTRGGQDTLNDFTPQFGNGAGEFDGVDSYLSIPDSADWDFSGGTWSFETFFEISDLSHANTLFSQRTDDSNYILLQVQTDGSITFDIVAAGSSVVSLAAAASTISADTTYHIIINEDGDDYELLVDGSSEDTSSDTDRGADYTGPLEIGRINISGSEGYLEGWLDETRILNGAFATTVPTAPYTSDANTKLLLHYEGDDQSTTFTDDGNTVHTVTANGSAQLHVGLMSDPPKSIFDYFRPSTNVHLIMGNFSTKLYSMETTGRWQTIATGLTDEEIWDFVNFGDRAYCGNGVDASLASDDGVSTRNWGIVAPSFTPTVATGAAGALTGDYQYKVTYYNSTTTHESSASAASATVSPASEKVDISGMTASADSQVDKKRIYRTVAGGSIFFFLAEIDDVDTTYEDNITDANLGTTIAPEENGTPGLFVGVEEWDGRIFGYEKNSTVLEFSNTEFLTPAGTGLPQESFSTDNTINFQAKIFGIRKSPNFNELWVHTSKGVFGLTKTAIPEDPYITVIRNSTWHALSHKSIRNIYNDQWFVAEDQKIISIDSAGNVSYESYYIEPTLQGGNPVKFPLIQAAHYRRDSKNQYRFIYPQSGQTNPDRIMAANYLNRTPPDENGSDYPSWEQHNIASMCIGVVVNEEEEGILYTGHSNGAIKQQDTGTNDDGVAIDWSFSLGWMKLQYPSNEWMPRWLLQYFNPLGDYSFTLRTDFDFGESGGQTYSVKAAPVGDQLDIDFVLDTSVLAAENPLKSETTDLAGKFKYLQLTWLGNVLDETMELHNIVLLPVLIAGSEVSGNTNSA